MEPQNFNVRDDAKKLPQSTAYVSIIWSLNCYIYAEEDATIDDLGPAYWANKAEHPFNATITRLTLKLIH